MEVFLPKFFNMQTLSNFVRAVTEKIRVKYSYNGYVLDLSMYPCMIKNARRQETEVIL